jgi:hypothetical protein
MESCIIGYSDTFTTYRIDITTQWKIMVGRDVNFDEDVRSCSSQGSPLEIEEKNNVVVPNIDSKTRYYQIHGWKR